MRINEGDFFDGVILLIWWFGSMWIGENEGVVFMF